MYRIIKTDGTELGITDSVRYIKISHNGTYIAATENDAVGIAYRNKPYNLRNHDEIPNADSVIVIKVDAGYIFENYLTYDALAEAYNKGVQNA